MYPGVVFKQWVVCNAKLDMLALRFSISKWLGPNSCS